MAGAITDFLGDYFGPRYSSEQTALIRMLQQQAAGKGPSLVDPMLEKAIAMQRSVAAGARPGQTAMAQRLASQNIGGLGGQAMTARLQEQLQAQQLLAQLLAQLQGQPSTGQRLLGLAGGAAQAGMVASDRTKKKNIADGGDDADALIRALKAHSYDYKDEKHGKGRQLGIMAQALEKVPGGRQAVLNTPQGKMVDTAKLTGALAAVAGRLGQRLERLEKKAG